MAGGVLGDVGVLGPGTPPPAPMLPSAPPGVGAGGRVSAPPAAPPARPGRAIAAPAATRERLYSHVLDAVRAMPPITSGRNILRLTDVDYADPPAMTIRDQKRAILRGETPARRLTGTWQLETDDGAVVDRLPTTVARVPRMTDTGTFILNGVEYSLAHQLRLRPGVYTRVKSTGEVEAHANVLPGKGSSHRLTLDPETGKFAFQVGTTRVPLVPVLKTLGATEQQIRDFWGTGLWQANDKGEDGPAQLKLQAKLLNGRPGTLREALERMAFDPAVNARTLRHPYAGVSADQLLATTRRMLAVHRGLEDPDDRDHMAFQTLLGPEDFFAERVRSAPRVLRPLLWRAAFKGSLKPVASGALSRHLQGAITESGLAQALEEVNPSDILDQVTRVSRLGVGGIGSVDAIPEESKAVQPSHLLFVDPIRAPESAKAGVDGRLTIAVRKGPDGQAVAPFRDVTTGETVYRTPQDVFDEPIAFAGALESNKPYVEALVSGRMKYVPRDQVKLAVGDASDTFNHLSNLIPLKAGTKGQRLSMGSRMLSQALPLRDPEAPLVQSGLPGDGSRSFEEEYGTHMGAVRAERPGVVTAVTPDGIKVRHDDGTTRTYETRDNYPLNRKTLFHNTPTVAVGDRVPAAGLLARSNYTDAAGTTALGANFRVAYVAGRGTNFEDGIGISESAAKRLTSEHMYQHDVAYDDKTRGGKGVFASLYPTTFSRSQFDKLDADGVVQVGQEVHEGDPLVLAVRDKDRSHTQVSRGKAASFAPAAQTWDHSMPGVVTDVEKTKKGVVVTVKAYSEMKDGDKLCFDPETKVLTRTRSWVPVAEVVVGEEVFTLNQATGYGEWQAVTHTWEYDYAGDMARIVTKQVDMLVTPNHEIWASPRYGQFGSYPASQIVAGGYWSFKKDCKWAGEEVPEIHFEPYPVARVPVLASAKMDDWLEFLGFYIAEGWCCLNQTGGKYVKIGQFRKSPHWATIANLLDRLGLRYRYADAEGRFELGNAWLYHVLVGLGDSYTKRVPAWVQALSPRQLEIFFTAYMAGDGHKGACWEYDTSSEGLAYDIQLICMKLGWAVTVREVIRTGTWAKARHWRGRVNRSQLLPTIRPVGVNLYPGNVVEMTPYAGKVYCVTVPNHTLYVSRDCKTYWSNNSGRYGDKGVVTIIPDEHMPVGADGRPAEVLLNPLGVVTRSNPGQIIEAVLGKIARKTGKPYKVRDFTEHGDMVEFALQELAKHGLTDLEDLTDPQTGRKIPQALTGERFLMKLHHQAEAKGEGRGTGSYTAEGQPAKSGAEASKRMALMDLNALLSHGATEVVRDFKAVRGQENAALWSAFMQGKSMPEPRVPFTHTKFVELLRAGGINPVRSGRRLQVMALTDGDVAELAGDRELRSAETVDWKAGLKPRAGGLFDPTLTGGHGGNRWAKVTLAEPLPNPVMEEPIRKLLGLTQPKFEAVLAGREAIDGRTGPAAVHAALAAIDLPRAVATLAARAPTLRGAAKSDAFTRLRYLRNAEKLGLHPRDWMMTAVPVLPPVYRPVSVMGGNGRPLVADANYLYKELFDANEQLKGLRDRVDDVGDERLNLYRSFKAVTGLGDPVTPKNQEREVRGVLAAVFGGRAKYSMLQRKLLSTTVDTVGRAVIAPNADLDMDSLGLPENQAWAAYRPFVVRRLVRQGIEPVRALGMVKDRDARARTALVAEMGVRPVVAARAPVLHRYGVMAFWPRLVKGDTMRMNPLVVKGFGADFDGDQMNFHVPASDGAVDDAVNKMLPSRNLLAVRDFKVHQLPVNEFAAGLYQATQDANTRQPERTFRTTRDAIAALRAGDVSPTTRIVVLDG